MNRTIPEGTAVIMSPYVMHRSARYFSPEPDKFWPERWISQDPTIVTDRSAFIPFSTGQANCPGKPLAIVQLRYTVASIVRAFDVEFADGYDAARWEKELEDRFVTVNGELPVKLTPRKVAS
jgi:cytochrome P450